MGSAVPVLLCCSFWQLGSPDALHIHANLYLTIKLQSLDTLLQTQLILLRSWPSASGRGYFYCQQGVCLSLQCFLEARNIRVARGSVLQRWLVMKMKPAARRTDRNCFNEAEPSLKQTHRILMLRRNLLRASISFSKLQMKTCAWIINATASEVSICILNCLFHVTSWQTQSEQSKPTRRDDGSLKPTLHGCCVLAFRESRHIYNLETAQAFQ